MMTFYSRRNTIDHFILRSSALTHDRALASARPGPVDRRSCPRMPRPGAFLAAARSRAAACPGEVRGPGPPSRRSRRARVVPAGQAARQAARHTALGASPITPETPSPAAADNALCLRPPRPRHTPSPCAARTWPAPPAPSRAQSCLRSALALTPPLRVLAHALGRSAARIVTRHAANAASAQAPQGLATHTIASTRATPALSAAYGQLPASPLPASSRRRQRPLCASLAPPRPPPPAAPPEPSVSTLAPPSR